MCGRKPPTLGGEGRGGAVDYLAGQGNYRDRITYPVPALLLLDLKLPQLLGLEVLHWIRHQPALAQLPVIICSGSDQDSDVEAAYALSARGYIVKPALTRRPKAETSRRCPSPFRNSDFFSAARPEQSFNLLARWRRRLRPQACD